MGVARVRGGRSRWQVWVTALRSGRAPWAGCSRGPGLPGLSWAAAWSWDGACYHILSLPCPAGHSLWPENFLVPERHDQLLRRSHHMSYFSERERGKIKIKPIYSNRVPGSGPTVDSKS